MEMLVHRYEAFKDVFPFGFCMGLGRNWGRTLNELDYYVYRVPSVTVHNRNVLWVHFYCNEDEDFGIDFETGEQNNEPILFDNNVCFVVTQNKIQRVQEVNRDKLQSILDEIDLWQNVFVFSVGVFAGHSGLYNKQLLYTDNEIRNNYNSERVFINYAMERVAGACLNFMVLLEYINKVRRVIFVSTNRFIEFSDSCHLCLMELSEEVVFSCKHKFCAQCLMRWRFQNRSAEQCPVCDKNCCS